MPYQKQQNPGALQGTEIVGLASPFGGWVHNPAGSDGSGHYVGSIEGVQAGLGQQIHNQYAESNAVTLFRPGRFGHLAPSKIWSAITDAGGGSPHINDLPVNGANRSGGSTDTWVVLKNGRLVRFQISATVDVHDITYNGTHNTHTAVSSMNVDTFMMYDLAATPLEYVFWSWEDSVDADIGYLQASTPATYSNGWFSGVWGSVLKKGVPHKVIKGPDGNLYVLDGSSVKQIVINGALGSAAKGLELLLGAGWTATGIVSYKNYVAITASNGVGITRSESAMFLWNGQTSTVNGVTSTAPQFIFPIPDNFANGLNFDGHILNVFTNGRNGASRIFEFTGKDFKQVFESPFIQSSTNPIQGGIENSQTGLLIGTLRNPVAANSYARLMRFYAGGFHDEGVLTDGSASATTVGMVKQFTSTTTYIGVYNGVNYQIYFDANTLDTYQTGATFRTILYTEGILGRRLYPLGFKGTVNRIQIYLSQWGSGASLTLSLFKDYTTASVGGANDLLNLLLDTDTGTANSIHHKAYPTGTTEIDITDIAITDISSFYMILTWSHASTSNVAAIIRRMIVHWAPSQ